MHFLLILILKSEYFKGGVLQEVNALVMPCFTSSFSGVCVETKWLLNEKS